MARLWRGTERKLNIIICFLFYLIVPNLYRILFPVCARFEHIWFLENLSESLARTLPSRLLCRRDRGSGQ